MRALEEVKVHPLEGEAGGENEEEPKSEVDAEMFRVKVVEVEDEEVTSDDHLVEPQVSSSAAEEEEEESKIEIEEVNPERVKQRKGLNNFWEKFKDGIIDLFKEEEDKHL